MFSAIINEMELQVLDDGDDLPLLANTWLASSHCAMSSPQGSTHGSQQTMSHSQ